MLLEVEVVVVSDDAEGTVVEEEATEGDVTQTLAVTLLVVVLCLTTVEIDVVLDVLVLTLVEVNVTVAMTVWVRVCVWMA